MKDNISKLRRDIKKHISEKSWTKALKDLNKIISSEETSSRYNRRAMVLTKLRRYDEAIADFKKALELDSQNKKAQRFLSLLEKQLGEDNFDNETIDLMANQETILESYEEETCKSSSGETKLIDHSSQTPSPARSKDETAVQQKKKKARRGKTKKLKDHFGRYKILGELGRGGMGRVYKAHDPQLDRTVALKVILDDQVSKKQILRFLQEVKATAKIQHPKIISIHDSGEKPEYYFTMEYIEGQTLSELNRKKDLSSREIAEIILSTCEAIEAAHQHKVIHRDLKPGNIMIDKKGKLKVMDFGLAKMLEGDSNLSRTGEIMGTPAYMPPEQVNGEHIDHRSDIYSIGAVAYELVTKRPVFQGESLYNLIFQVSNQEPVIPSILNPDIDRDVETIILKCLEKSPDKRYQGAGDLADDLRRYLNHKPIWAKPPTLLTKLSKWVIRNKALAGALAAVVLITFTSFCVITNMLLKEQNRGKALNMVNEVNEWIYNKRQIKFSLIDRKFSLAQDLAPDYFIVYQQWGKACAIYARSAPVEQKKYNEKAMGLLETAVKLNPQDYLSMYISAQIYELRKDKNACFSMFCKIADMDPPVENEYGYIGRARRLVEGTEEENLLEVYPEAIEYCNMALEYNPSLPCAYYYRGMIQNRQNNYQEALDDLNKALEIAPFYEVAYLEKISALWKQERFLEAENDLMNYLSYVSNDSEAYYKLATLFSLKKEKEKALEYLRLAFENGFEDVSRLQTDKKLDLIRDLPEFQKIPLEYQSL